MGVYGTSWLVAIGCCFAEVLDAPRRSVQWAIAMVFASVGVDIGLSLQRVEWTSPKGTPIAVAVVQPNVPLREKWDPRYRSQICLTSASTPHARARPLLWSSGLNRPCPLARPSHGYA